MTLYHLKSTSGFKIKGVTGNHKSTILVCMTLNGRELSNWLWSTWVQSCFLLFLTGQSNMAVCVCVYDDKLSIKIEKTTNFIYR